LVELPDSCRNFKSRLIAPFGRTSAFWRMQHRPRRLVPTQTGRLSAQRMAASVVAALSDMLYPTSARKPLDYSTSLYIVQPKQEPCRSDQNTSDHSADGENSSGALEHKVCLSSRTPSGQCLVLNHLREHPGIRNRSLLPTHPIASGGDKTRDSDHNQHCPATPTRCLHSYRDSLLTSRNIWGI